MGARQLLLHGLLAGLVAGLVAFGVASVVGEPAVEAAIALEGASHHSHEPGRAHDPGGAHEPEPEVSRGTQRGIGLLAGMLATGLVLGGLTGLAAAAALGRLGSLAPAASTALVTGVAAVSFSVVPFLKYPATPPAAGDPSTIDERTAAYFGFVTLSVAAAVGAVWLGRRLLRTLGEHGAFAASACAVGGYVGVVAMASALLPAAAVGAFPGQLLWDFRVAALLVLLSLWATLAVVLTGLVDRTWSRVRAEEERRALAASL